MKDKLKFHGLMLVNSKHMIERYNRALKESCGFETNLKEFHIDCSGYSHEIAEECSDIDYLNTHGASKRFIILSVEQACLPIAQSYFSSTVHFINKFISDNYKQILSMTALDSVYGELENNIFKIKNISDVLYATKVEVKVETSKGLIKSELDLNNIIEELRNSEDSNWLNDENLEGIIEISNAVGDVRKNTLQPDITNYEKKSYYANHLGGMYVFKKSNKNIIIATKKVIDDISSKEEEKKTIKEMNIKFIELNKIENVYEFLDSEEMIESLSLVNILNSKDEIKKYMNRIAIEHMIESSDEDIEYSEINENKIKTYISKNYESLGRLFEKFNKLNTQLQRNEEIDSIDEEIIFYFAKPSENSILEGNEDIITHLIACYTEYKYEENFSKNRELFLHKESKWSDKKKKFVESVILNSL